MRGWAAAFAVALAVQASAADEVYDQKFDFVPGERLIAYDDFSDTPAGDFPRRWSLEGYGAGGSPMAVVEWKGRRWLTAESSDPEAISAAAYLRLRGGLPRRFTLEVDVTWPRTAYALIFNVDGSESCSVWMAPGRIWTNRVNTRLPPGGGPVAHLSLVADGTYVKVYLGGQRVINDPDCLAEGTVDGVRFMLGDFREEDVDRTARFMMTGFRLAEGGRDLLAALTAEGRVVTHGITFDSGSDVVRPESGPVLRQVLAALQKQASLRLEIQGHTDDQGGDKVNQPLSERRARAVKGWVVKHGIAEGRLQTRGLGASKPIDRNDSAEGRASNRRVELVRLTP